MPFSGTPPDQTFARTTGLQSGTTAWADTETAGRGIEATDHDFHDQDVGTAINLLLKRDGGNKPTADIDWNEKKIVNLGDPVSGGDAANKDYVDATATGFENFTVRAASTANVNLTTDVDDGSTFDSITLATNDLILLKNQTDASENGVYVVPAGSGTAARSTSFDTWDEFVGSIINVTAGTVGAGLSFRCTVNSGGTLESTDITYAQFGSSVVLPLPIGSGGSGQTTAAAAFNALKQAATDAATGVVELATTAEVVTGTDTTRAATSAGVAAAIATLRLPRVSSITSSSTPTPDGDATDLFVITAQAAAAAFAAPGGTPSNGQKLMMRVKDNGTARALTWNAIYRAGTDVALPSTTVVSKTLYLGFIYNSSDSKWDLVAAVNNI